MSQSDTPMSDPPSVDPLAAVTESLTGAIQSYIRASVAAQVGSDSAQPHSTADLQARYDAVVQENKELKDQLKHIEILAETEKRRDTIRSTLSTIGFPVHDTKILRHLTSNTPKAKFCLFDKLPVELRMKIWKLALPGGRIFELYQRDPHFRLMRVTQAQGNNQPNQFMLQRQASGLPEMSISTHKTPKLRLACKEANRAFREAGGFEFGLFGGVYKGLWFNYSEDILYVKDDPTNWVNLDMSRIIRVGFSHVKFLDKASANSRLDMVLDHFASCREVIVMQNTDWDMRACYAGTRMPSHMFPLRDEDVIGNHEYSKEASDEELGTIVCWREVKSVVENFWMQHVIAVRQMSGSRVPKLKGVELVRGRHTYFE
ncbi:hypothetical protein CCHL11_00279 [Colletotrichum chlorophyti]|uniref:2EXR domain-containing protein n=1 Tax=Colletotrichum chlorophyti TaxID=708187 RepID=A0A1Q8RUG2_9PEZI|nr:hypothetical protein CCHL11_00279 [Colletotrichum chlorophyti]